MPNNPRAGGISRRIEGDDRDELRAAMSDLDIPDGMGVIVRTAGVGRSSEELNWDLSYLLQLWEAIKAAEPAKPRRHCCIRKRLRAIRDNLRPDIGEFIEESAFRGFGFISRSCRIIVTRFATMTYSLFSRYQIESQIKQPLNTVGWWGQYCDRPDRGFGFHRYQLCSRNQGLRHRETALNTNLEAADEIAANSGVEHRRPGSNRFHRHDEHQEPTLWKIACAMR